MKTKGDSDSLNTLIGKGTSIKGDITVNGSLRIDGSLEGSLNVSNFLIVGTTGSLKATNITVKNAIIGGRVSGNITVEEKLELESSSSCIGDLKAKILQISPGAVFDGNCSMSSSVK